MPQCAPAVLIRRRFYQHKRKVHWAQEQIHGFQLRRTEHMIRRVRTKRLSDNVAAQLVWLQISCKSVPGLTMRPRRRTASFRDMPPFHRELFGAACAVSSVVCAPVGPALRRRVRFETARNPRMRTELPPAFCEQVHKLNERVVVLATQALQLGGRSSHNTPTPL